MENQDNKLNKALTPTMLGVGFTTPLLPSSINHALNYGVGEVLRLYRIRLRLVLFTIIIALVSILSAILIVFNQRLSF